MRPIKFRGRDIDNGDFVYGDFGRAANTGEPVIYFIDDERNWVGATVDEDSVAQLVGYDSDGREVYEGDVLTFEHDGKHYEYTAGLHPFARNDDGLIHYKFDSLKLKEEPKP